MNELIKIHNDRGNHPINYRELADFLRVRADQIKRMISQYPGISSERVFPQTVENTAGRPTEDIWLSIEGAKMICMIANSVRGEQARRYFLECESRLKSNTHQIPKSFAEALQLAADQARELENQKVRLAIVEPKAAVADRIANAEGMKTIGELATHMKVSPQKRIREWLLKDRYIYKHGNEYRAYEYYLKMGIFSHVISTYPKGNDKEGIGTTVYVTGKGIEYLTKKWNAKIAIEVK